MQAGTVVFGTVFMDCKGFAANRYDPLGRNVGTVRFIHGGVGRNVAENLALAGSSPVFVSSVDEGGLGGEVLARLAADGVDVSRVRRAPSHGMGIWLAVMDERGELASSISQMPDLSIMESVIREEGEEIIRAAGSVILEVDLNDFISGEVLRIARKYSKKVYGITGNMEVVLRNKHFLRELECYICNETEAGRLFDAPVQAGEPERVLETLVNYVDAGEAEVYGGDARRRWVGLLRRRGAERRFLSVAADRSARYQRSGRRIFFGHCRGHDPRYSARRRRHVRNKARIMDDTRGGADLPRSA